tara:strand:+ start:279 stop:407 length:129 start_codon:yes stop_codon:yes gene_type:complete
VLDKLILGAGFPKDWEQEGAAEAEMLGAAAGGAGDGELPKSR